MKALLAALAIVALTACNDHGSTTSTGKRVGVLPVTLYKACIDGVTYYLYDRSITPVLDTDSKIVPCK